ncbi:MAG: glucosamine-6-phosphate deaminase [Clostridia bacterium]|nr:glucosamine-6-phosphate deaminase [Clostridia bacterium]
MKIIVTKDYETLSEKAAEIMISVVRENPNAVLGLATGSTPIGLYRLMAEDHQKNGTSYKNVRAVNLDEYLGLPPTNDQSYRYFMRTNLFDHLDIDLSETHIEDGLAKDEAAECARYDALLRNLPRDIQLLGIGANGHIAFNEPGTPFETETHVVSLTENTIAMNARFFKSEDEVPRRAFTMGPKSIMEAKKILILAVGENKARAVREMAEGPVSPSLPASILRLHPDCTLIADEAAASLLKKGE